MANKYLEEIGYTPYWSVPADDNPKFQMEREIYGFDQRETWDLDETFAAWAYSRLRRLKDVADIVDWYSEETMIDIPKVDDNWDLDYVFVENVSLGYAIDLMLENFKYFLQNRCKVEDETLAFQHLSYAAAIWGRVLPALWW